MPANPLSVHDDLRDAYLRYFDTAFWLRDPRLMAERRAPARRLRPAVHRPADRARAALRRDGAARRGVRAGRHLTPYRRDRRARAVRGVHAAGQPRHAPRPPGRGGPRSFQPGTADGRNVIVTSGTGSGKTESFLLPVLLRLVEESASWAPQPARAAGGTAHPGSGEPSRGGETRPAAVRALVLYPTNALVEDQMIRLRRGVRRIGGRRRAQRSCGSAGTPAARWAAPHARARERTSRVAEAAAQLSEIAQRVRRAREGGHDPGRPRPVRRPAGTRDAHPLGHDRAPRQTSWSRTTRCSTRCSCASSSSPCSTPPPTGCAHRTANVLTLVVDELHLYRGTQGSEVAMVIRNLLMRLGLEPDSPQLRVIGTSASLADRR